MIMKIKIFVLAAAMAAASVAYSTSITINVYFPYNTASLQGFTIPSIDETNTVGDLKDTIVQRISTQGITIPKENLQLVRGSGVLLSDDAKMLNDPNPTGSTPQPFPSGGGGSVSVTILKANHTSSNFLIFRPIPPDDTIYNGSGKNIRVDTAVTMSPISICPNCAISNIKYNGRTALPVNAGKYAITIDVPETEFYNAATNLYVDTFTITPFSISQTGAKSCSAAFTYNHSTYNGIKKTPIVSLTCNGISGAQPTLGKDYIITTTNPNNANLTDAGRYNIRLTGTGNYTGTKNLTNLNGFYIDTAIPTAANLTYDLSSKHVSQSDLSVSVRPKSITGTVGDTVGIITVKYDGSTAAPTAAGTYAVSVQIAKKQTSPANYKAVDSLFLGYYTIIGKKDYVRDSFVLSPRSVTYNGSVQAPTITPKPTFNCPACINNTSIKYNGRVATTTPAYPRNAGLYIVTMDVMESDSFNAATAMFVDTFRIEPFSLKQTAPYATVVTLPTNPPLYYYNGQPQVPLMTALGAVKAPLTGTAANTNLRYNIDFIISATNNTNAGRATLTVTGIGNYIDSKTPTVYFNIDSIMPIADNFDVAGLGAIPYDGQQHKVGVSKKTGITGMGLITDTLYNGSTTPPVAVGTYEVAIRVAGVTGTINPTNPRNYRHTDSLFLGYLVIQPKDIGSSVAVRIDTSFVYDGTPHMPHPDSIKISLRIPVQ